ncbi:hypothetical protein B0J13DRAFT_265844 [Dactylonectria estremocensis]|uniref:Mid2 domain-containing protein n=1 Tax=Dactylonectria estremocensis TaxID=1079267 RepID=A0A9P9JBD8_9HYPO|nr:hypothetical protein B0J13DRAFT_265844 [Dactylonectria estremocensis]
MLCQSIVITYLATLVGALCYYQDGSAATDYDYEPCNGVNTTFRMCCHFQWGDECLPSGLCMYPGQYDYRAACENQDWEGCPEICPDSNSDSWVQVKTCTNGEYCCNIYREFGDCCEDGSDRFGLEERPATADDWDNAVVTRTTATKISSTDSIINDVTVIETGWDNPVVTVTRTTTTSSADVTETTQEKDEEASGGLSLSDKIALGCGLGIGIPTLIVGLCQCMRL